MKTLIVGASGATGRNLVHQILEMGHEAKVVVRSSSKIPEAWNLHDRVTIIRASINEIGVDEMAGLLRDCQAAASCLGHNLNLKGIYGKPRKLVTDAVRLICDAITQNAPQKPFKFVLMNTTGNPNRDLKETHSFGEKIVLGLVRLLLPPQTDNEQAAEHLRLKVGQGHPYIKWVAVRPDSLINEDQVTEYTIHASPIRSPIFNSGKTSRINVGNFMAKLLVDDGEWGKWEGQMPVIYNRDTN